MVQVKHFLEVIKEGVFGWTYFRDNYFGVNGKWYKKSWKEFGELKDIDKNIIARIIMMLVLINTVLNVVHH